MQLRYKKDAILKKVVFLKQSNGSKVASYNSIKKFVIQPQEITDEISASVYGADIKSMLRIKSIRYELENFLKYKINNSKDNLSNYFIEFENKLYKIVSVKSEYLDLKVIES